jgi:uncharacterized cupredoxin-like copper-binding protein
MNRSTGIHWCALLGAALIATAVILAEPSARADEMVAVTLADKGMESMRMDLSAMQVKAGNVIFNVTNTSQTLVHEFVVVKSDKPVESMLYNEDEKEIKEDALEVVNEIEDIDPGKSGTLTITLQPGSYILLCNKAGHFKAGMVNRLTVIE